jgi:hypothetical protein
MAILLGFGPIESAWLAVVATDGHGLGPRQVVAAQEF